MKYVQLCLFAKIWHVSQIFPLPHAQAQHLTTICSWYLWPGATFRVPLETLQRPRQDGGWGLPNVVVNCKTLLYFRITMLGTKEVMLQRIFSVTGTSGRLSPTPLCPPHPSQACTYSPLCHRHVLCGPPLHPTKQVNISSGGYIMPYTKSQ